MNKSLITLIAVGSLLAGGIVQAQNTNAIPLSKEYERGLYRMGMEYVYTPPISPDTALLRQQLVEPLYEQARALNAEAKIKRNQYIESAKAYNNIGFLSFSPSKKKELLKKTLLLAQEVKQSEKQAQILIFHAMHVKALGRPPEPDF